MSDLSTRYSIPDATAAPPITGASCLVPSRGLSTAM
jgi:hypothetical protein